MPVQDLSVTVTKGEALEVGALKVLGGLKVTCRVECQSEFHKESEYRV